MDNQDTSTPSFDASDDYETPEFVEDDAGFEDADAPEDVEGAPEDGSEESNQEEAPEDDPKSKKEDDGAEDADGEGEGEFIEIVSQKTGKTYKIPAELQDEVMLRADHTRKTQALAEDRRKIEEQARVIEERGKWTDERIGLDQQLKGIQKQIDEYDGIDWVLEAREAPEDAARHQSILAALERQKMQLEGQIKEVDAGLQQTYLNDYQNRVTEGMKYGQTHIDGWSPELASKLGTFAEQDLGLKREFIADNFGPEFVKITHLAYLGSQLLANKQKATTPPPKAVERVEKVGANKRKGAAETDLERDELSDDEWISAFNDQYKG